MSKDRLRDLAKVLRQSLPIKWNFEYIEDSDPECGTSGCALGVAAVMWPEFKIDYDSETFAKLFDMGESDFKEIFVFNDLYGKEYEDVTPTDVANAIDYYLEHGDTPLAPGAKIL